MCAAFCQHRAVRLLIQRYRPWLQVAGRVVKVGDLCCIQLITIRLLYAVSRPLCYNTGPVLARLGDASNYRPNGTALQQRSRPTVHWNVELLGLAR